MNVEVKDKVSFKEPEDMKKASFQLNDKLHSVKAFMASLGGYKPL